MAIDFKALGDAVSETADLTVDKKTEREIPRAGGALLRLIGYIETGKHLPTNPAYKAAYKCILIFELNHPDHMIELDGGEKVPQRMFVHLNIGSTAKSGYRKLFTVMNNASDGRYKHFIHMMGDAFLAKIYHNTSEDGKKKYANLHLDGAWSLMKPVMEDVMTGKQTPIPIPEAEADLMGFLWENDGVTDENLVTMWNALYIDGEKQDGSSKNWIQETIMSNTEWEGSRTEALTQEFIGLDDPETPPEEPAAGLEGLAAFAKSPEPQPDNFKAEDVPY